MKYIVKAPDKNSVFIASKFGYTEFKHETIIEENNFTKLFPEYFLPIDEEKIETQDLNRQINNTEKPNKPKNKKQKKSKNVFIKSKN